MKKLFAIMAGVVCLLGMALFVGCGGSVDQPPNGNPNGNPTSNPVAQSITVTSPKSISSIWGMDETAQIFANIKYVDEALRVATSEDITFTSNSAAVATVDTNGLITFRGIGMATITVSSKIANATGGFIQETVQINLTKHHSFPGLQVTSFEFDSINQHYAHVELSVISIENRIPATGVRYQVSVAFLDSTGKYLGHTSFGSNDTIINYVFTSTPRRVLGYVFLSNELRTNVTEVIIVNIW
ncbi:MAG: Ig-like domain-containing protein [Firmicutes bacterium]|nr:Ig-like domain-containing protein [Bacillota bacterium]